MNDSRPTKILALEDDPRWQQIIRRALDGHGYEVECVAEGGVALAIIDEAPPDVLLVDVHLPGITGFDVLRELRETARHADLPALVITSEKKSEGLLKSFELGADDYLSKPFKACELRARIASKLRVRKLQEQLRVAAEATAREIEMARSLQRRILPLPPPARPGMKLEACYRPSSRLGGDYFDVLPFGESCTGLFLADVVGHGARAALVTSFLKALFVHGHAAHPDLEAHPCAWMGATSRDLLATFPDLGLFVTAIFAVVDPSNDRLTYVNAGHCEPLLQTSGGETRLLRGSSLPLGVSEGAHFETFEVPFLAGDRLLLYTDGLLEQPHHETGGMFGGDRLREIVEDTGDEDLSVVLRRIEGTVLDWAAGDPRDDIAVLACERTHLSEPGGS